MGTDDLKTKTNADSSPGENEDDLFHTASPDSHPMNTDAAIRRLGGCGLFQTILTICVIVVEGPAIWSTMFMAFGNYNPGWTCTGGNTSLAHLNMSAGSGYGAWNHTMERLKSSTLEHTTLSGTPSSVDLQENTVVSEGPTVATFVNGEDTFTCEEYSRSDCGRLQFSKGTSTIVTEWGLICDKNWIVNLITSLGMAGSLVGNFLGGQLNDRLGRKPILYTAVALSAALNGLAVLTNMWALYATLTFCLGITSGIIITVHVVHMMEFTTARWRPVAGVFPGWNLYSALLALTAMGLKDWRRLHGATALLGAALFCTALWVPESFRWLVVKGKVSAAHKLATRISQWNKSSQLDRDSIESIVKGERDIIRKTNITMSIKHLFIGKNMKITVILIIMWFMLNLVYYSINFGVRAISGNLYVNLILFQMVPLPFMGLSALCANVFGRKSCVVSFLSLSSLCCIGAGLVNLFVEGKSESGTAILVLALITSSSIASAWGILRTFSAELYPTVIRLLACGFLNTCSRLGAILAPFFVPTEPEKLHFSYLLMGGLGLCSCVLFCFLPETKGAIMTDTDTTREDTPPKRTNSG